MRPDLRGSPRSEKRRVRRSTLGFHIPKGYTYFAMGLSVAVEMLNLKIRKLTVTPVASEGR
jgi:predicted tellurium resistance membrane protein TerC